MSCPRCNPLRSASISRSVSTQTTPELSTTGTQTAAPINISMATETVDEAATGTRPRSRLKRKGNSEGRKMLIA